MNKVYLLAGAAALMLTGANALADADSSVELNVDVEISHIASLSKVYDLSFSHIAILPNATGDIVVHADPQGFHIEGDGLFVGNPYRLGEVRYTKYSTSADSNFTALEPTITVTASDLENNAGDVLEFEPTSWKINSIGLSSPGRLGIGGDLTIPHDAADGAYHGTVTVDIVYTR